MWSRSAFDAKTVVTQRTSDSTPTPCPPPTKRARILGTDAFKSIGTLTFRIDNFCEFSKRPPSFAYMRHCDAKVSVRGLTFGLAVYPCRLVPKKGSTQECMCMGIRLYCKSADNGSWSCLTYVTLRIKTLLKSSADEIYQFTRKFLYQKGSLSFEDEYNIVPWSFDHLMDQMKGLCSQNTLELIVEISADPPIGILQLPKTDVIQVNEEMVLFNKNQLAMHSRYFHSMFYNAQFDEGQTGVYKVWIEAPATVKHFRRMLDTLYPENRPLTDRCIEGVLHLANRFLMTDVEGKCVEFLMEESTKSALFKYRVADKYGYTALKNHVLGKLEVEDFEKELFKVNMAEYVRLGPIAAKAVMSRYDELFPPPAESQSDSDDDDE